jgi:hypothetical protein
MFVVALKLQSGTACMRCPWLARARVRTSMTVAFTPIPGGGPAIVLASGAATDAMSARRRAGRALRIT